MEKPEAEESVPPYACRIHGRIDGAFTHTPEAIQNMRKESCQTCGYPNHHAGPLCPCCSKINEQSIHAMAAALTDWLSPRHVHIYGIGRVDPWTRRGRNLIGDG